LPLGPDTLSQVDPDRKKKCKQEGKSRVRLAKLVKGEEADEIESNHEREQREQQSPHSLHAGNTGMESGILPETFVIPSSIHTNPV
jgi:hypothetical protein